MRFGICMMMAALAWLGGPVGGGPERAEAQEAGGRFAFVTPTANSHRLHGAVVDGRGEARVYGTVVPGRNRGIRVRVDGLNWSPNAGRIAVRATERGPGTRWVFIYSARLAQEFARPARAVARDLARTCPAQEATGHSGSLTVLQNNGFVPRGSTLKYRPGSGEIRGMNFVGWINPNRFVLRVSSDPELLVVEPDGKISQALRESALGRVVPVFADYRRRGGEWQLQGCLSERPAVAAGTDPRRSVKVNANGRLIYNGAPVVSDRGERLPLNGRKALLAAGPR